MIVPASFGGGRSFWLKGGVVSILALIAVGVAGWALDDTVDRDNVTVYERFERRPSCGKPLVSHHALVALKPNVAQVTARETASVTIDDPAGPGTIWATIRDGQYFYENLFGKAWHAEQWREYCEPSGRCQLNLNYYTNEHLGGPGTRDIKIRFWAMGGKLLETVAMSIQAPSTDGIEGQDYVPIDARIENGNLVAQIGPADSSEIYVVVQIEDAAGRREKHLELGGNTVHKLSEPLGEQPAYAGVFAYTERPGGAVATENKLELLNNQDPAYRCFRERVDREVRH